MVAEGNNSRCPRPERGDRPGSPDRRPLAAGKVRAFASATPPLIVPRFSAEGIDDVRTKRAGTACDADGRVARRAGKREFDVVGDVNPRDGAGATPGIAADQWPADGRARRVARRGGDAGRVTVPSSSAIACSGDGGSGPRAASTRYCIAFLPGVAGLPDRTANSISRRFALTHRHLPYTPRAQSGRLLMPIPISAARATSRCCRDTEEK